MCHHLLITVMALFHIKVPFGCCAETSVKSIKMGEANLYYYGMLMLERLSNFDPE